MLSPNVLAKKSKLASYINCLTRLRFRLLRLPCGCWPFDIRQSTFDIRRRPSVLTLTLAGRIALVFLHVISIFKFAPSSNWTSCPSVIWLTELVFAKLSPVAWRCFCISFHFISSFLLCWVPCWLKGVNFIARPKPKPKPFILLFCIFQLYFMYTQCKHLYSHFFLSYYFLFVIFFNFTEMKSNLIWRKKKRIMRIYI